VYFIDGIKKIFNIKVIAGEYSSEAISKLLYKSFIDCFTPINQGFAMTN